LNRGELFEAHKAACQKMHDILRAKSMDYAQGDDPFSNFTLVEKLGIASTEQSFLTRMMDKFSRLISFVRKGTLKVKDESVEDTLLDLANYCILLALYIRQKRKLQ